jgi:hypothetical protein
MDASLIRYDWEAGRGRGVSGKAAEDKVIVDMPELADSPGARGTVGRADEPRPAFARGTRDHVQVPHSAAESATRSQAPRELERDAIAVLRAWPHSTTGLHERAEPTQAARPPSRAQRRIEDKIVLAHLALDLYRELDELQDSVQRVDCAGASEPAAAACTDPHCGARTDVLRGALVEACLLVQRVAMMAPAEPVDIEDRIHELLQVLQR